MIVELISVGTELLLGNIVNTNTQYLAEKCALLGLSMYHQVVVGDNHDRLAEVIRTALGRSDIVILTGGLGPTEDDMTKEVCAQVMDAPLEEDAHTRARIEEYFRNNIYRKITDNNWKQALVPAGARVLDNDNGTAPGLILEKNGKVAVLLPGPPGELYPLFEEQVYPYLQNLQPEVIRSQMVKVCGIGESGVEDRLLDLIDGQTNPTIATYAKTGEVHVRVTARAADEQEARKLVKPVVREIRDRLGDCVYTVREEETLEMAVVRLLEKYELTVTTAESCTGGQIASRLVNVPGVSDVFREGFVTYSNKAKRKYLDVSKSTLKKYGAVSEQTEEKPVGLVYIATYMKNTVTVEEYRFKGNRQKIREQTVVKALDLVRRTILKYYKS